MSGVLGPCRAAEQQYRRLLVMAPPRLQGMLGPAVEQRATRSTRRAAAPGSTRPPRARSAWMHRATFDLVWLGVLILTPGVGVPAGPVCPAFPLRFRLSLSAGGRVRPVGVVPGWPGTAGTRPAPTASAAEGASGGGGRSGPAEPGC